MQNLYASSYEGVFVGVVIVTYLAEFALDRLAVESFVQTEFVERGVEIPQFHVDCGQQYYRVFRHFHIFIVSRRVRQGKRAVSVTLAKTSCIGSTTSSSEVGRADAPRSPYAGTAEKND